MSPRQAEQAKENVEKQATPAAEDVCPMCEYWTCRCPTGVSVSGGVR